MYNRFEMVIRPTYGVCLLCLCACIVCAYMLYAACMYVCIYACHSIRRCECVSTFSSS